MKRLAFVMHPSWRSLLVAVGLVLALGALSGRTYGAPADEHGAAEHAGEHSTAEHAAAEHAAAKAPNPLTLDPDLAIWTAVVFLVLLIVLGKFAWKPIVEALEAREKRLADHLAAAEAQNVEARQMLSKYETRLASAADEVRLLLDEARRDAEHTKSEILAEAKAAAQAEQDRALREVRNAKDAALKEIGETGANFAVKLAGQIVGRELKTDDHNRLIRDSLDKLPSSN